MRESSVIAYVNIILIMTYSIESRHIFQNIDFLIASIQWANKC
jgi:hypothetical protein